MSLGQRGLALIESFEQCRLKSYQDQRGVWTIGWGHTGPDVGPGQTCTQDQADAWLVQDLHSAVMAVIRSLDVAVTQNQFDALVAFTFNVGIGAESHSTLLRLVNAGRLPEAAEEFPKWDHVDGVPNAGLARRREAERELFLAA